MSNPPASQVEVLLLGSGWISLFILPLLAERGVSHASTSRDGSKIGTIPFTFDPLSDDPAPFQSLPRARTIVIVFPIKGEGGSKRLVRGYESAHGGGSRWIQLGSTGIWEGGRSAPVPQDMDPWINRHTPPNPTNERYVAEQELLDLSGGKPIDDASGEPRCTTILNLAGLVGLQRSARNLLTRVAKTKEMLAAKGSIHLISGLDVARAVVLLHDKFTPGERWILTDMHVYDWWSLFGELCSPFSPDSDMVTWVPQLMAESGVVSLPRQIGQTTGEEKNRLPRALDGSEFWKAMGSGPVVNRLE